MPCSRDHKRRAGCSGQRDKAAYVAMNQYGWGTMMNDYTYLEHVGRHVTDWGREIVKGGFSQVSAKKRNNRAVGKSKRDFLKLELEKLDITMDLMPNGMERRKLNQSYWDTKSACACLTVEFRFFPPPDPSNPLAPTQNLPITLLTHRNRIDKSLLKTIQDCVLNRQRSKKESALPDWVQEMVFPAPEDPDGFKLPQCVMKAHVDFTKTRIKSGYVRLDPSLALAELLKDTQFVEFPTVEVWDVFRGVVIDKAGLVTQLEESEHGRLKRRKIDTKTGKGAISGLLDGYGSEDLVSADDGEVKNGLGLLGEYGESMDETEPDDEEADESDLNPEVLLRLIKEAQKRGAGTAKTDGLESDASDD